MSGVRPTSSLHAITHLTQFSKPQTLSPPLLNTLKLPPPIPSAQAYRSPLGAKSGHRSHLLTVGGDLVE